MAQVGLTRTEYAKLGSVFPPQPHQNQSKYPKTAREAVQELRQRGYQANESYLGRLVRAGSITLPEAGHLQPKWTAKKIDEVAAIYEGVESFTSEAIMCRKFGIRLADYLRELKRAYQDLVATYGENGHLGMLSANPNENFFVKTFYPPFRTAKARVEFTLAEPVRKELDRRVAELKKK